LIAELRRAFVERMRVTSMSRIAMLFGRSLRTSRSSLPAIVMMVRRDPFGLRLLSAGLS